MGFFNDGASAISSGTRRSRHSKHTSSQRPRRSRSSSSERSTRSRAPATSVVGSLFGAAASGGNHSGFFTSSGKGNSRPSYYKRTSRPNFLTRCYRHLRRLLRDILHWARRHPIRVFMLIILPLLTSGALVALLARFGLRIPAKLDRWLRTGARAASGDTFGAMGDAMALARGRGVAVPKPYGPGSAQGAWGAYGAGGYGSGSVGDSVRSVVDGPSSRGGGGFWSSAVKFFTD